MDTVDGSTEGAGIDRRTYLTGIAAGGALGLGGCLGESSDGFEVLHGWTGGDGKAAIDALTSGFEDEHSDIDANFQAVGGDGNVDLNATIMRQLTNQNVMSSFANWPGKNLERYRDSLMDHEEDVWEAEGYKEVMQDRVIDYCTFNDKMPVVPIGSHRMNNLFYNTSVFEEAGVNAESLSSVSDLMDALERIDQRTDVTPFSHAMVAPFTGLQTWAQIFTSQSGVDAYMNFIEGNGDRDAMIDAFDVLQEIRENYIPGDASSIGYTDAGQKIIGDLGTDQPPEAACIHGGNWLYGMFREDESFNYGEEWDWIPFPGTEGVYFYHVDSFVTPTNNPTEEETIEWQKYVGTKDVQIAFNNPKGSVPLRTDIEPDKLTDFLSMTYDHLTNSEEYPPTIAHGLAVEPEVLGQCKSVIGNNFQNPYDAEAAADGLLDAVSQ